METVIYEWPASQICMDCKHSLNAILPNSMKICSCHCKDNDGVKCPLFEPNDDYNNENEEENKVKYEEGKEFIIPCTWTMYGHLYIRAKNIDEALAVAYDGSTPLPTDGEYMDDSFYVEEDMAREIAEQ